MNNPCVSNSRGMTLIELLISTIIVGIMVGGIYSAYFAMMGVDRGASRRAAVSIELQAVTEHMRRMAVMATGTIMDQGVRIGNSPDDFNYICFRQDLNSPPTPNVFTDDVWACYTRLGTPRVNVYFCRTAAGAVPTFCNAGDVFLGRALMSAPQFDTNTGTFSVLLVNRFDPSAGIDWGAGGTATQGDEVNPQAYFPFTVHPDASSFH